MCFLASGDCARESELRYCAVPIALGHEGHVFSAVDRDMPFLDVIGEFVSTGSCYWSKTSDYQEWSRCAIPQGGFPLGIKRVG